jgi:hypothetical protein
VEFGLLQTPLLVMVLADLSDYSCYWDSIALLREVLLLLLRTA